MSKYDKIRDSLSDILDSFGYEHKIYDQDGQATTDIFDARYIFCNDPNFMIIIRAEENEVEFHKGDNKFEMFQELIKKIRSVTKSVFVRLNVMAINQHITPKLYSKDVQRNKRRVDKIVTESMLVENVVENDITSEKISISYSNQMIQLQMNEFTVDVSNYDDKILEHIERMVQHPKMNLTRFKNLVDLIQANQLVETFGSNQVDAQTSTLNEKFLKLTSWD